jgi:hypothetical protein
MDLAKVLLIVRWLLGKGDVLPQLLQVWERLRAATTISEYFAVGEELFRILSVESTDFPDLTLAMSAEDCAEFEEAMKGDAAARKIDWAKLFELAKAILPFVLLFLEEKNQPQT